MCCGQKRLDLQSRPAEKPARSIDQYALASGQAHQLRSQPAAPPAMRAVAPQAHVNPQYRAAQAEVARPSFGAQSSISIRYLESSLIRVRGPVSGRHYEFSGSHSVQQVDARDAASLLNTRFFRRV